MGHIRFRVYNYTYIYIYYGNNGESNGKKQLCSANYHKNIRVYVRIGFGLWH